MADSRIGVRGLVSWSANRAENLWISVRDALRAFTATYDKYGPSNGRRCSRARPGAVTGHASNFTSCIRTSYTRFLYPYKDMQKK